MELIFQNMGTDVYAISPEIHSSTSGYVLTMTTGGCSHILILRAGIDSDSISFEMPGLQKAVAEAAQNGSLGDEWCSIGMEGMEAMLLNHVRYITNGNRLLLEERAARYAIAGCIYDQSLGYCQVNLPDVRSSYSTVLSITVRYRMRVHVNQGSSGFGPFKKVTNEETPFYQIQIEHIPGYEDGNIFYTFRDANYKIPVTKEMLGKTFLVKRYNGKAPEFSSAVDGIKLTKEG
jgi:hypothetical protein